MMGVHQHEKWQLRESGKGGQYCAACGETLASASMADVVKGHRANFVGSSCHCGMWRASRLTLTTVAYLDEHAEHVAEQLSVMGFGKLEDAWDDGNDSYDFRPNPYRRETDG